MEYGHPVAPSHGHQQIVRPHAPLYDEEPITEPRLHAVVVDEQQHHEKKPVLKKVKDKVKKIKDSIIKKKHGHGDEHYVEGEGYDEEEDEEMEVEPDVHGAHMYQSTTIPHGYGSGDKPFTLDSRDKHIDLGTLDSLSSRDEHVPLSRGPVIITSRERDEHVPLGPISRRDENPFTVGSREERATLGVRQKPPITPETIKDTTLEADPAAPLPYGSVPPTDELSVSPEVLISLQAMTISVQKEGQKKDQHGSDTAHLPSDIDQRPTYTEKLSSTAAGAKDAAMSAASTIYSKVAGTTPTGAPTETRYTEEVEKKPSYTEKLSSTATAAKDAAVSTASNVYGKVAGGTHSTEPYEHGSTPVSTGPAVEIEGREGVGEKKGSYTEKLSSTAAAAKDAAVSAASNVYGKVAGGTHSTEPHNQGSTLEPHNQGSTLVSTGPGVVVEAREGAGENKGSYTEKLSSTAAAAKDAAVHAASAVYGKVAGGTHSTETHDQRSTPLSTRPGVEVEARHGAGEKKGTYTEKLSDTALAAKDAAANVASTVYGKVAGAGTAVTGKAQPGGATEQDKGVLVREYLVEKVRPGEEDRALSKVISESMKKRGEEQQKGRIVLPEVTAGGVVGEKLVVGTAKDSRGGGEGMVEKIKGAVSSLVGSGGVSGGSSAAMERAGGGAARERAHDELDY